MDKRKNKTAAITFRCTKEEAEMIAVDAYLEGCSESELIRNKLFKKRHRALPREYSDYLADLLYEIKTIGKRVEGIQSECNISKAVTSREMDRLNKNMESLVAYFAKIYRKILDASLGGDDET